MKKTVDILNLTDPKKYSVRFDHPGEALGVSTIYVLKSGLGNDRPPKIQVTIEWPESEDEALR